MEDEALSIAPLKNNDDIKSELVGHHFATLINGITLTIKYKETKAWKNGCQNVACCCDPLVPEGIE